MSNPETNRGGVEYPQELVEAYRIWDGAQQSLRDAHAVVNQAVAGLREAWLSAFKGERVSIGGDVFARVFDNGSFPEFYPMFGEDMNAKRLIALKDAEFVSGLGDALIIRVSEVDADPTPHSANNRMPGVRPNDLVAFKVASLHLMPHELEAPNQTS